MNGAPDLQHSYFFALCDLGGIEVAFDAVEVSELDNVHAERQGLDLVRLLGGAEPEHQRRQLRHRTSALPLEVGRRVRLREIAADDLAPVPHFLQRWAHKLGVIGLIHRHPGFAFVIDPHHLQQPTEVHP